MIFGLVIRGTGTTSVLLPGALQITALASEATSPPLNSVLSLRFMLHPPRNSSTSLFSTRLQFSVFSFFPPDVR